MKTTLRRTESYKMLQRTTKPLRRRVLIEEGLAKSSKMQHLENTDKWHLCKAGSFSYGESPRTPPLEGTSLHRWNIVWRDPGGSWACLPPVYHCVWNHTTTGWDMWTTPKKHTKKRETQRNAIQNKTTSRARYKKVYDPLHYPSPPRKHSELKDSQEMLNKTKTTIAR